jgi:hypothetical protein
MTPGSLHLRPFSGRIASCFFRCALIAPFLLGDLTGRPVAAQETPGEPFPQPRFFELLDEGYAAAEEGDHDRALALWLVAFDESRGAPELEEARLTLALDALVMLAEEHEPAVEALVTRRDAAERRLLESRPTVHDADEAIALNASLSGPERSLALYDRYRSIPDADPEIVTEFRYLLWTELIAAGRYEELADLASVRVTELIPLMEHAREAIERFEETPLEANGEMPASPPEPDAAADDHAEDEDHPEHYYGDEFDLVAEALELYEILLGAGREDGAAQLAGAILMLEAEAEPALEAVRAKLKSR